MPAASNKIPFRRAAKAALAERDMTVTALADRLDYARVTVSIAINNPTAQRRAKQRIAKFLSIPLPTITP